MCQSGWEIPSYYLPCLWLMSVTIQVANENHPIVKVKVLPRPLPLCGAKSNPYPCFLNPRPHVCYCSDSYTVVC